jgi:plasmid maintenance system antidote protein VapI
MNILLDNIRILAKNENLTIAKLEREIGASKSVLSRAIAKKTDIQAKWVLEIAKNYPKYSCEWLIMGEGSMLKETIDHSNISLSALESGENFKVLAESRKETIESLQKVIYYLEKQIEACKEEKKQQAE